MGSVISAIVPQIVHLPYQGFDVVVTSDVCIPGPILLAAKCVHIAHFVFRRIEQVQSTQADPYACFTGAVLLQFNDVLMVQIAVKVALIGRILFEINDRVEQFQTAYMRLLAELRSELPVSTQFLIEETSEEDYTQDLPLQVELYQHLPKSVAAALYRLKWIIHRLNEFLKEFIILSRELLDLYDALVTASGPLEYFQLLPNLKFLIHKLEEEPVIFSQFVRSNEETFVKACQLLKLEGYSKDILRLLENTTYLISEAAKGMQQLIVCGQQVSKGTDNFVNATGFSN